ncbi:hypothetical protein, partial [Klebsiella pneumoniae]|uniref:hypothetical protein n=1 Tax=Klebsiella pneumoniae TaxID=573 RepID=UPI001F4A9659
MAVKRFRRSRKTGFQHVQEAGSSTAGNHPYPVTHVTPPTTSPGLNAGRPVPQQTKQKSKQKIKVYDKTKRSDRNKV